MAELVSGIQINPSFLEQRLRTAQHFQPSHAFTMYASHGGGIPCTLDAAHLRCGLRKPQNTHALPLSLWICRRSSSRCKLKDRSNTQAAGTARARTPCCREGGRCFVVFTSWACPAPVRPGLSLCCGVGAGVGVSGCGTRVASQGTSEGKKGVCLPATENGHGFKFLDDPHFGDPLPSHCVTGCGREATSCQG